ncbi:MAG TPA: HAD family hydrolase [Candidatus Paceibacterota bacterium]|nr:HAD family hydrolase [Candidatus Paceibacterota bacterium]
MKNKKALFLDRDGVICEALPRGQYLTRWEEFKLMPGISGLIDEAKNKGYLVIVITNQPQISKGIVSEAEVALINNRMNELLDGKLDAIYHCPHRNEDNCDCRKPKPGMLLEAGKDFEIDFSASFFLGDADKDVKAGQDAGCKTIFLKNEHNEEELKNCNPDVVIDALEEAIEFI